jgi:hypothetical protein
MVARPEDYARSSAAWWSCGQDAPLVLCRRKDLPFGLSHELLRKEILRFQGEKRLDDVMEAFAKSGFSMETTEGRLELGRRMAAAGLEVPMTRREGVA